jgi:hypothetical protein
MSDMNRATRAFLAAALLAAGLLAPAVSRAQTAEEAQAFALFKEGRTYMDAGDCTKAVDLFRQAYAVFPLPQIMLRLAECRERQGDLQDALETYRRIPADDPKVKAKVDAAVAALKARMEKPPEVLVEADVPDVDVTVDQVETHRTPVTLKLAKGTHRFEFRRPGYRTRVEDHVVSGGAERYAVTMQRLAGQVVLTTDQRSFQGIVVRIDERELAPAGAAGTPSRTEPMEVPAGRRRLLCVKEGLNPYLATFDVPADGVVEVACSLGTVAAAAAPRRQANVGRWATFGAGTAVALAGAGLTGWYFAMKGAGKVVKGTDYQEGWIGVGLMGVGVAAVITAFTAFPDKPAAQARDGATRTPPLVAAQPLPGGGMASFTVGF